MLNPLKVYKAKVLGTIVSIEPRLQEVTVEAEGQKFTGYLDRLDNNKGLHFKVGDTVRFGCRFSIMSNNWTIKVLTKVRG